MRERPILFSAPMVRAILEGRKSMTRRIVKCDQNIISLSSNHEFRKRSPYPLAPDDKGFYFETDSTIIGLRCPYGVPGDRLWVRETWAYGGHFDPPLTLYKASYPECVPSRFENIPDISKIKWSPSIHMFRKDSRLNLEVLNVRVERLQEISEYDAREEGIPDFDLDGNLLHKGWVFKELWNSINGPGSWEANPWVWVIEFKIP